MSRSTWLIGSGEVEEMVVTSAQRGHATDGLSKKKLMPAVAPCCIHSLQRVWKH